LLEIRIVEAGLGQGLDLADGGEVVDIVARQTAAVDAERVDVKFAAGPADQFLQIAIDGEIKPAEMDGAAARSSRDVGDVVADPDGAEIQSLGRKAVMPFVEPFRGQPFGGIFVLGAGGRAGCSPSCPRGTLPLSPIDATRTSAVIPPAT
jgi:hypothetical protein